jgi:integrase
VRLLDRAERPDSSDERPKRVLASDELDCLTAAVDPRYRLLFELAAQTGARLSEALGLVWGDVDLDGQSVRFAHQLAWLQAGAAAAGAAQDGAVASVS